MTDTTHPDYAGELIADLTDRLERTEALLEEVTNHLESCARGGLEGSVAVHRARDLLPAVRAFLAEREGE